MSKNENNDKLLKVNTSDEITIDTNSGLGWTTEYKSEKIPIDTSRYIPYTINETDHHEEYISGGEFEIISDIICECGKDKHGFARHAEWCVKYE